MAAARTRSAIGVVVVGLGIAGRVRVRDLQECTCGLQLKGFVSRRDIEMPGVTKLSLAESLQAHEVDAIIICTEPETHEEYVRQCLEIGKHVLVEYPVALSSAVAADLYTMAANKGLILHEENIGLLTESHQKLREMVTSRKLKTGTNSLTGKFNGWVEKLPQKGKPFLSNIGALQAFYDLFGDLKANAATLDVTDTAIKFCGEFSPKSGDQTLFVKGERYKEPLTRETRMIVEFEDGEVFDSAIVKADAPSGLKKPAGLFMQDLVIFAAKVRGERPVDADVAMSVRCIEIAEEAHALLKNTAGGTVAFS